jgi:hypothetical protein
VTAGTMRSAVRAAASCNNKVTSESDVDTYIISLLPIGLEMTAFTSQSLISSALGLRYLIRIYRTGEVRVHGYPVRYWGSRYRTDGPLTTLLLAKYIYIREALSSSRLYKEFILNY